MRIEQSGTDWAGRPIYGIRDSNGFGPEKEFWLTFGELWQSLDRQWDPALEGMDPLNRDHRARFTADDVGLAAAAIKRIGGN